MSMEKRHVHTGWRMSYLRFSNMHIRYRCIERTRKAPMWVSPASWASSNTYRRIYQSWRPSPGRLWGRNRTPYSEVPPATCQPNKSSWKPGTGACQRWRQEGVSEIEANHVWCPEVVSLRSVPLLPRGKCGIWSTALTILRILRIQSRTNKYNKSVISWSAQNSSKFGHSDCRSDSGWRETSKNTLPKFFPRVVVLAKIFGELFQKNVAVLSKFLVFRDWKVNFWCRCRTILGVPVPNQWKSIQKSLFVDQFILLRYEVFFELRPMNGKSSRNSNH